MRTLMAAWIGPILALTACGTRTDNGADAANAAATPPGAEADAPGEQAELAALRETLLGGCIGGGRDRVGPDPNVPVEAHCACAVDRELAGKTLAQAEEEGRSGARAEAFSAAMRQCIAEISPDYQPGRR